MGKEHTSPQIPTLTPHEQAAASILLYLREQYSDHLAEEAAALWQAFHQNKQHHRFRKPLSHAAAFLCAFLRLRLAHPPTPQALAKTFKTSNNAIALRLPHYDTFLSAQILPRHSKRPTPPTLSTDTHFCTTDLEEDFIAQEQDFLTHLHTLHKRRNLPVPPRYTVQPVALNTSQYDLLRRLPLGDETWIVGVFAPPPFHAPQRDADLCVLWMRKGQHKPIYVSHFSSKDKSFCLPLSFLEAIDQPQTTPTTLPKQVLVAQRNSLIPFRDFLSPLDIEVSLGGQEEFTRLACTFHLPTTNPTQVRLPSPNALLSPETLERFHQSAMRLFDTLQQQTIPCCVPFGLDFTSWGGPVYTVCTYDITSPILHFLFFSSYQDWRLFTLLRRAPHTLSTLRLPPLQILLLRFVPLDAIPSDLQNLHPTPLLSNDSPFPILCEWWVQQQQASHASFAKHEHATATADALTQLLQHPAHPTSLSALRSLDVCLSVDSFPSRPAVPLHFPQRSPSKR